MEKLFAHSKRTFKKNKLPTGKKKNNIVFEDGLGNKHDIQGNEIMEFEEEADNQTHPVKCITDYSCYTNLKPPKKKNQ
ncbi:hypothetical protein A0J61_05278 [Choanephora cucurbitarum]|uniref:Uncharacterized protein n=1 Tax=Choanephora cucurbitarum TaxID=101091 RepID=A0A1C7NC21_9FUNG|nr:hypothetical protein A0J61_05278 [Choanephora cucurbitarum]